MDLHACMNAATWSHTHTGLHAHAHLCLVLCIGARAPFTRACLFAHAYLYARVQLHTRAEALISGIRRNPGSFTPGSVLPVLSPSPAAGPHLPGPDPAAQPLSEPPRPGRRPGLIPARLCPARAAGLLYLIAWYFYLHFIFSLTLFRCI